MKALRCLLRCWKEGIRMRGSMTINVDISREEDGSFLARVREYPGCWASGPSENEALGVLLEMLPDYLEAFHGMSDIEIGTVEDDEIHDASGASHRALVLT